MKCTWLLLLIGWLFLPFSVQATLPLFLDAEVSLSANYGWDLQRMDNDSTYAVVWTFNSLIYYRETLNGSTQQYQVPDSVYNHYNQGADGGNNIAWVKLAGLPTHRCVVWTLRRMLGDIFYNIVALVDLTTETILDVAIVDGGVEYNGGSVGFISVFSLTALRSWPPLPAVTQFVYCVRTKTVDGWGQMDVETYRGGGDIYRLDLRNGTFANDFELVVNGTAFSFFADTSCRRAAFGDHELYVRANGEYVYTELSNILGSSSRIPVLFHWTRCVVPPHWLSRMETAFSGSLPPAVWRSMLQIMIPFGRMPPSAMTRSRCGLFLIQMNGSSASSGTRQTSERFVPPMGH